MFSNQRRGRRGTPIGSSRTPFLLPSYETTKKNALLACTCIHNARYSKTSHTHTTAVRQSGHEPWARILSAQPAQTHLCPHGTSTCVLSASRQTVHSRMPGAAGDGGVAGADHGAGETVGRV